MLPGGVEFATPTTDVVDNECVADALTLPLDGDRGGDDGGNNKLMMPAEGGGHYVFHTQHCTHLQYVQATNTENTNLQILISPFSLEWTHLA